MNTIAIFGQYKTGTTIIFQTIKESLRGQVVHEQFEPSHYTHSRDPKIDTVLAKVILGVDSQVEYDVFLTFDHQIYIVRDPRDWLISGLLFICQQEKRIWSNRSNVNAVLDLLRLKEHEPGSVSVYTLMGEIARYTGQTEQELLAWMVRQQNWLAEFESRRSFHMLRYEQFVTGDFSGLESYLGIKLTEKPVILPKDRAHSARTRSSGNWKSWFTESDIEIFKPVLDDYMIRHNYDRSWGLDARPRINAVHGSEYVSATINKRQKMAGIS